MRSSARCLLLAPPLAFLGIFYFYPLLRILFLSFSPEAMVDGGWGAGELFHSAYYPKVLWFTFWQAGLSTLLTLALALPGAFVMARYSFRGKALIQSLTALPFVLPTVVTAAAFQALLGPGGVINRALIHLFGCETPPIQVNHTVGFFLLAHIFYNYTVVLRLTGGFWANLPTDLVEAGRMLGASRFRAFRHITLPLLMPAICASGLLVFIFCFTSFGIILILGGPRLATVEVEIYRQAVHLFNLPLAAALSLVQILFTFLLMGLYTTLERRAAVSLMPAAEGGHPPGSRRQRWMIRLNMALMLCLLGAPLLALAAGSLLTETGPGLTYYRALFENRTDSILFIPPAAAIGNSLLLAAAATLIALTMGWLAAAFLSGPAGKKNRFLDPLLMLPLSTSAVTLGFGYIVALDAPPLNLRTSLLLPAIAHSLVAFPFVIRSLLPALRGIPPCLREAAAVLGAAPLAVWRHVEWPIIRRALAAAAVFAFAISLGEFGATVFVARPRTATLPLAIYRYLTQPGPLNHGQAMAMSCILMATTAAGFLLLDRFSRPEGARRRAPAHR